MKTAYALSEVRKTYKGADRPANDGISFEVPSGEAVGIIGPNGAGKTTLVRSMLGLLRPDGGRMSLFGIDVTEHPEAVSRFVAYLPQQGFGRALTGLTVREAVVSLGRLRGLDRRAAELEAVDWIERLRLSGKADAPLKALSGGQRRLAALACVLIGGRSVLVLDEPTNDLDPESRRCVWEQLRRLREAGTTVIVNTHNLLEAESLLDRVVWLSAGRLVACEPAAALRSRLERVTVDLWSDHPIPEEIEREAGRSVGTSADRKRMRIAVDPDSIARLVGVMRAARTEGRIHWSVRTPTLEDVYFERAALEAP
ncbi:MAG: ABC transporter ATP-binding protein [Elusimicrobia bacterium CG_4_9_14_3_um_filter_62_55]|nr:MAG: export ABC transporter ATP-binding protein [Elusimicrobia bacterium CG22_combo_CG10-13_8_21_14_all_63_91]PJA16425.1 MAG: ABC transporter ATP-binding protein [Elusimicrobia bacterium CG_4_10_14_0_2_um_filter_63_34]PJB25699.1 MAG: ABC transporter ATP-binding protein [Elusimicrobia bacterium CG_4_9_14_3_um_filter_62_55]